MGIIFVQYYKISNFRLDTETDFDLVQAFG